MPFTLVVQPTGDRERSASTEKEFDQSPVTIGRGAVSDLVLNDTQRRVSSRHAEIRKKDGSWCVVDIGSTNGTKLNDLRLTPNKEYPLGDGDCIAVGTFKLTFRASNLESSPTVTQEPAAGVQVPVHAGLDSQALLYILRRAYADSVASGKEGAAKYLEHVLRQTLAGLDRATVLSLVGALREELSVNPELAQMERADDARVLSPQQAARPSMPIRKESVDELLDMVKHFCGDVDRPWSKSEAQRVVGRIFQTLEIVFGGLADAVKGRRKFQKEFEVEATQILSWKLNPIKQAENAAEIGAILLNPEGRGLDDEEVATSLREVFQDLTLHQLGLLAGFRECVRGLLKELDPEDIGRPAKGESSGKGIGLLGGGNARSEAAAWRRYVEKHRKLSEEEVKVFERILAPHFAKGYLSVHKARRRS